MSLRDARMPRLADKLAAQAKASSNSLAEELETLEEELAEPRHKGKKGKKKAGN